MLLKKAVSIHENLLHGKNVATSSFRWYESPHMTPDRFKQKKSSFVTSAKAALSPPTVWEPNAQVKVEPPQFSNVAAKKQVVAETRRFSLPSISPKKHVDIEAGRFCVTSPRRKLVDSRRAYSTRALWMEDGGRFSVTSPTRRVFVESRRVFSTRALWLEDDCFAKTKVFQSRFVYAATTVQKNVRRFLQRHYLTHLKIAKVEAKIQAIRSEAATRIQTRARGMIQRVSLIKFLAARSIQAGLRGMCVRYSRKLIVLEQQLAEVEDSHQRELAEIKVWKKKQMKQIRREMGTDEKKKQKKDLDRIHKCIKYLRKENTKIRSENEDLQEACEKLAQVNQTIEKNIEDVLSRCDYMKENIRETEKTNLQYDILFNEFERRKQVYIAAIEKRDEVLEFEQTVAQILRRGMSQIMGSIRQSKGCDSCLVDFFTNLEKVMQQCLEQAD
jgi:hypothetical protein